MIEGLHEHMVQKHARATEDGCAATAGIEHVAERFIEMELEEVLSIDETGVCATLTDAGAVAMMPLARALGLEGAAPANAVALIRWYRRAFDLAVLVATGTALDRARSMVLMERPEESITAASPS